MTNAETLGAEMRELGRLLSIGEVEPAEIRDRLQRRITDLQGRVTMLRDEARSKARDARDARRAHFEADWELRTLRHYLYSLAAYVANRT